MVKQQGPGDKQEPNQDEVARQDELARQEQRAKDGRKHETDEAGRLKADKRLDPAATEQTPEERANETGEPVHFEGTIVKIDRDGNEVVSDHLMPGEKLRRSETDDYLYSQADDRHENSVARREQADREKNDTRSKREQQGSQQTTG
jgi:hypothetical protein